MFFNVDLLSCRQGNRLNMTFCGPARDTLFSNQGTEKFNFDTNYITNAFMYHHTVGSVIALSAITICSTICCTAIGITSLQSQLIKCAV